VRRIWDTGWSRTARCLRQRIVTRIRPTLWPGFAPVILVALVFWPALGAEFVWDDLNTWSYELPFFRSLRDVLQPPAGIVSWSYAYYRPVVVLSYQLDIALWGPESSIGPHVANVVYHAGVTFFVWLLARRLLAHLPAGHLGAFAAAMLFAVHPIHTESVSWIAGRSDVLATLFLLPCILAALEWRDRRRLWCLFASPVLFLLGVLAKETAISALALVPLTLLLAQRPATAGAAIASLSGQPRRPVLVWAGIGAALLCATGLYLWMRQWAGVQGGEVNELAPVEALVRLLGAGAFYLRKLIVPWPQSNVLTWEMAPGMMTATATILAAAALTGWSIRRHWRSGDGTFLLMAGWLWVTMTVPLFSAVWALSKTPLAERQLYLPSIAVVIGLGTAFCLVWSRGHRQIVTAGLLLLVAAGAVATIQRGLMWRTDVALWSDATAKTPTHGLAWLNLGLARGRAGDEPGAHAAFVRVIDTAADRPIRARAHTNIGMIEIRNGRPEQAEAHFRSAITLHPESAEPYFGLASVYTARADRLRDANDAAGAGATMEMGMHFLGRALVRHDGYHPARLRLAALMQEHGQLLEQHGAGERALQMYRGGLAELDGLLARLPVTRRAEALRILRGEVGIDATALRERLERDLARLQGQTSSRD
jgi:hypothetical protein